MVKKHVLVIEIAAWFLFSALCYRLSEVGLWIHEAGGIPEWMNTPWWLNDTPFTAFDKWTFSFFRDSYHFFNNLPRVALSIRFIVDDYKLGAIAFFMWWLGILILDTYFGI